MIGVRALLVDAALHPTDSSALAFEIAARAATLEALQIGEPVMLEPIMRLDIVTPEEHVDSIVEDLKARRGHTDGRGRRSPDGIVIVASVPAANLFGYAAALLSMAGERAAFCRNSSPTLRSRDRKTLRSVRRWACVSEDTCGFAHVASNRDRALEAR